MTKLLFSLSFLLLATSFTVSAQDTVLVNSESRKKINALIFEGYQRFDGSEPLSKLLMYFSDRLVGTPYESGLLDRSPEEKLLVDLRGLDCVTYIEHVTALGQTVLKSDRSFESYMKVLTKIRYGNGKIEGYDSRLHYFSEWMLAKQQAGQMEILFQDYENSVPLQNINFMTTNWDKYPRLKENPNLIPSIKAHEDVINSVGLRYVPKEFITDITDELRDGDIVSFVTKVRGLDVTHTGIIRVFDDHVSFYHASTSGKVKLEPRDLYEYVRRISSTTGIMVARFY